MKNETVKVFTVGWGEERTPTLSALQAFDCWGSFLTPTYELREYQTDSHRRFSCVDLTEHY